MLQLRRQQCEVDGHARHQRGADRVRTERAQCFDRAEMRGGRLRGDEGRGGIGGHTAVISYNETNIMTGVEKHGFHTLFLKADIADTRPDIFVVVLTMVC